MIADVRIRAVSELDADKSAKVISIGVSLGAVAFVVISSDRDFTVELVAVSSTPLTIMQGRDGEDSSGKTARTQ